MYSFFKFTVKKKKISDRTKERFCNESAMSELGFEGFPSIDMLRYDNAKIIGVSDDKFILEGTRLTKDRWKSFDIEPELISVEKLNEKDINKKIDENRLWFAELTEKIHGHCEEKKGNGFNFTGSQMTIRDARDIIKKLNPNK